MEQTIEKMKQMKLYGLERAYGDLYQTGSATNLTIDEAIAHLIDAEYDERYNRKLARLIKTAGFRQKASIEQINYSIHRNIDKNLLLRLQTCDWIKKNRDLLIVGPTGVGKSFIACALGFHACSHEIKTIYSTANKLFDKLLYAKADGSYLKEINKIAKAELLIIDDFGLKPLDSKNRNALLEIIDDRHAIKSTIIASQLPVKEWFDVIGEPTVADAILDRLIHGSYRIEMQGESMRKLIKKD
jgi:DNA replication protein DnaC